MTSVGKEYGTALFMLASEENARREYYEGLMQVSLLFTAEPSYPLMLACPAIPKTERLSAIEAAFPDLPPHIVSYLQLLCEKGRIGCFSESVKEYKALLDASERVLSASVTSARELTDGEKERLTEQLSHRFGGRVAAEYGIDPALLSGMVVEIDGRVLDGSLRRRLDEAKEVMNK